jgi:hypothetical protein
VRYSFEAIRFSVVPFGPSEMGIGARASHIQLQAFLFFGGARGGGVVSFFWVGFL